MRFEQVKETIMGNEDLREMLRNNPPDVVSGAFAQAFFEGAIPYFQRDNEIQNIFMKDKDARNQIIELFFSKALREIRGEMR